jgi:hypothetical protein
MREARCFGYQNLRYLAINLYSAKISRAFTQCDLVQIFLWNFIYPGKLTKMTTTESSSTFQASFHLKRASVALFLIVVICVMFGAMKGLTEGQSNSS